MSSRILTIDRINTYAGFLREEERAPATAEKYLRDIRAFAAWLGGRAVAQGTAGQWREALLAQGLSPPPSTPSFPLSTAYFVFWAGTSAG